MPELEFNKEIQKDIEIEIPTLVHKTLLKAYTNYGDIEHVECSIRRMKTVFLSQIETTLEYLKILKTNERKMVWKN